MAVRRSQNWLNQQRVDVPHLRAVESAVRNDFDELIGAFAIGESKSYIIRGFELNMVGAIGSSATSLQMIVDGAALFHGASDESGTFFQVPEGTSNEVLSSTTNTKIDGSFTPSALNYVGIEFTRQVDDATSAQIFLWNPTNKTEISKTTPLAQTFDYKVVITSSVWAANVLPISIVETDTSNNVIAVQDRRPMLFRLGSGGVGTPDPFHIYPWNNDAEGRVENFWESSSSTSPFRGGDKQILHFKEWADSVMSNLLEVKGTTYWYSENPAGSLTKMRGDLSLLQMTGTGKYVHSEVTAGQMNWTSNLKLHYVGSRLTYTINGNASSTDVILADNQVAYFNIVRDVDIIPNLVYVNSSAVVTSVGAVAWTGNVLAGDFIKLKSEDDTRYFKLLSVDSASQVTLTEVYDGATTGSSGIEAQYAWGSYETNATPSTDRHIQIANREDVPFDSEVYWLYLRSDNGESTARIYIRGASGGELQQGEDREISDNTTLDLLDYMGSQSEVDTDPDYTNAIQAGIKEETLVVVDSAANLTSGQYMTLNSALDTRTFYVWVNIDAADGNPYPAGLEAIEIPLTGADSNLTVAAAFVSVIDALGEFNVANNFDGSVTIVNSQVGAATDAANVDLGGAAAVSTPTDGVGAYNHVLVDDENLTKGEKRLDQAIGVIQAALDTDPYEEMVTVVAGAPANDQEATGPVVAGTSVKIPYNTRNGNVQETYVPTEADLVVFLNGQRLCVGADYVESSTTEVQFNFELVIDDIVKFTKAEVIGAVGSGGTSVGVNLGSNLNADVFKQTIGNQLQFRRLEEGSGVTIVESADKITISSSPTVGVKNVVTVNGANYSATSADDAVLVINNGVDVTITLPDAATVPGLELDIKKIASGNTLFIKSVFGQELDGIDIDASPHAVAITNENTTVLSNGANWFIL